MQDAVARNLSHGTMRLYKLFRQLLAFATERGISLAHYMDLTALTEFLRISDVATLAVDSLKGNRLTLYQAKTGEFVSVLIPPYVAEALRSVPHKNPQYFFWSGKSKITTTGFWRARIAEVFKLAKIENGHSHRFRDSFAVSPLEAGVSLENVSTLLGHQSIRVTEKDYLPWIKTRQDALDKAVQSALGA